MTRIFVYVLIAVLLFIGYRYQYHHPGYNWDMLPYMGVALEYENADNIHAQVYAIAKREIPPHAFTQLTDSIIPYRSAVYQSPELFRKQMPFYVVKPLYTRMVQLFYKAGIPLTKATVMSSLIASFLLVCVMLHWFRKYLSLLMTALAAIALSLWGPVLLLSKTSGPDALSALLLVGAVYCMLEKTKSGLMYFLLLLSILTRIDNLLPAALFISVYSYYIHDKWKQRLKTGILLTSGCIVCYFFVGSLAAEYNWSYFYYTDFYKHLHPDYNIAAGFSFQNYVALVRSQVMTGLYYSQLPLFLFLSLCLVAYGMKLKMDTMLLAAIWLILAIRFILHPVMTDRLYAGYYLIILMMIVRNFTNHTAPQRNPT